MRTGPAVLNVFVFLKKIYCISWPSETVRFQTSHQMGHTHHTIQYNTTQHNTTQHNTTQHNTTQHNTTQHNTTQHNTTQHNTTQHNTTQHNTTQYNTIQILLSTPHGGFSEIITKIEIIIIRKKVLKGYR